MQLPANTWIVFPSPVYAAQFRTLTINESRQGPNLTTVILDKPVVVVSEAWIAERNEAVIRLSEQIDTAKARNGK